MVKKTIKKSEKAKKIAKKEIKPGNFEKLTKKELLKLLRQYYEDNNALKIDINKFKQQINEYEYEILKLKQHSGNMNNILFYDYATKNNHNNEWNDVYVSFIRLSDCTLITPKSGNWFEPVKNNNNFFLPSKFRIDMELIEYNPFLRVILLNKSGKSMSTEIGYSDSFNGRGHLTIIYDNGEVKISINEKDIKKRIPWGDEGMGIRFDLWSGKKLKFKEFIIREI